MTGASHPVAFPLSCRNVLCLLASLQTSSWPQRASAHFCGDVGKVFGTILKLESKISISVLIKLKNQANSSQEVET